MHRHPTTSVCENSQLFAVLFSPTLAGDAACAGCVAHGAAADVLAARFGTRGMLATDLFSTLQRIVNPEVTDKNHDESSNSAP